VLPTLENIFKVDDGINKCQGFVTDGMCDEYDVCDVNMISVGRDLMC